MTHGHPRPHHSPHHGRPWLRITRRQALVACTLIGLIVAFGFTGLRLVQQRTQEAEELETRRTEVREARR